MNEQGDEQMAQYFSSDAWLSTVKKAEKYFDDAHDWSIKSLKKIGNICFVKTETRKLFWVFDCLFFFNITGIMFFTFI